jgi:hypothetical protein
MVASGIPLNPERVVGAARTDGSFRATRPPAASLLAREIVDYFQFPASAAQPGAATAANRPAPVNLTGAAHPVARSGGGEATASSGPLWDRDWPALTGQQLAGRLHTFVADGVTEPLPVAAPPRESQHVASNSPFPTQAGSGADRTGDVSLFELSDQMAEILRQQAIQHGIDVT